MRDVRQIVRFWHQQRPTVLMTLVGVDGSSYRQTGAHLLLAADGSWAGTISGGCLEATVVRRAQWKVRNGAVVEHYSTMFDDVDEMPFGSGCGGVIDLLMEPAGTPECHALMTATEASLAGEESTSFTWLPSGTRRLSRAILTLAGEVRFRSPSVSEQALRDARASEKEGSGRILNGIFVKRLKPPQRLFIMGAGDDAKPLCSMAALLGWNVIVSDMRAHLARPDRFPEAHQVAVLSDCSPFIQSIHADDAVVLMTHSFDQDQELLTQILPMRPGYLGLLGARKRSSLLVSEVAATLGISVSNCCEWIHAPIGLDLGGDGPEAIALSVLAEIQACFMGKLPTSRKLSPLDIERYAEQLGNERIRSAHCSLDVA